MKRIVCEECKKVYDYDRDEFCPRCGAFTPPVRTWGVDAQGNVVRVDGVSEQNHAGSFVHREVHREKAVRRMEQVAERLEKSGSMEEAEILRAQLAQIVPAVWEDDLSIQ